MKDYSKSLRLVMCLLLTLSLVVFSTASFAAKPENPGGGKPGGGGNKATPLEKAHNYLVGQVQSSGLIRSYNDSSSASYTYDNALAIMAFVAIGDSDNARTILGTFQSGISIPASGGYHDVYDFTNGVGSGAISAGPNSWLLNAVNLYRYKTGDLQFQSLGQQLADYLVNLQDADGGLFGGESFPWKSAEHNQSAYAALYNFGMLSNQDIYVQKANLIKNFLFTECWDGERFLRGKNDYTVVTDVQALGVLSLGTSYASAIYWAEYHTKCTHNINRKTTVTGFDFNDDLDTVWLEGTLQQAIAFNKNYDDWRAGIYYEEVNKTQRRNGSFLLATNEGTTGSDWILMPIECVAPTCWYIFYNTDTNPLMR
jgi:hypothetical protein